MLEIKPNCECCDKDLPPESTEAVICSIECTFCKDCSKTILKNQCPNCGGNLVERPIRSGQWLVKYPASTNRVINESGCKATA